MGQTIRHKYFTPKLCPCKSLARRIHHILSYGGNTESYICKYTVTEKHTFSTVTLIYLMIAIQFYLSTLKLHHANINPDLVGVNFL